VSEEPVSYVNAPRLAEDRGLVVRETQTSGSSDRASLITVCSSAHAVAGTLASGDVTRPRSSWSTITNVEVPPAQNMVIVRNDDRPGMIGVVGTVLGEAAVSIVNMAVGQTSGGKTALMVLATDRAVSEDVLARLAGSAGILDVHQVTTT